MNSQQLSTSIAGFNRIFAQLIHQPNTICWLRSIDYQRQLYLSDQFESIFGGSCDSLYNDPKSWWSYLIPHDINHAQSTIDSRIMYPDKNADDHIMLFRIKSLDGKIRYIRDTCLTIYNNAGTAIAIAGIGEELSSELWHLSFQNQSNINKISAKNGKNILEILEDENKRFTTKKKGRQTTIVNELQLNGMMVKLTNREAQVLYHLRLGKTAKETAQDIFLSPRTVETHLDNLKQKTFCKSKLELMSLIANLDKNEIHGPHG